MCYKWELNRAKEKFNNMHLCTACLELVKFSLGNVQLDLLRWTKTQLWCHNGNSLWCHWLYVYQNMFTLIKKNEKKNNKKTFILMCGHHVGDDGKQMTRSYVSNQRRPAGSNIPLPFVCWPKLRYRFYVLLTMPVEWLLSTICWSVTMVTLEQHFHQTIV